MLSVSPYTANKSRTRRQHSTEPLPALKMTDMASPRGEEEVTTTTTNMLEVWLTKSHIMLKKRGQFVDSLWYSREDGSVFLGTNFDVQVKSAPVKLCHSFGLIGKIKFLPDSDWYLLLIKDAKSIGTLPPTTVSPSSTTVTNNSNNKVYCIEQVIMVPLSVEKSIDEIKMETYAQDRREKDVKEKGKLEKKLHEALLQMFNGSKSFYFSYDIDLTQSVQRKHNCGDANKLRKWQQVDERFFWNKEMLNDLLDNNNFGHEVDDWILPIIQGYIEIKHVPIPSAEQPGVFEKEKPLTKTDSNTTGNKENEDTLVISSNEETSLIGNREETPVNEDTPVISSNNGDAPVISSNDEDAPVISSKEDTPVINIELESSDEYCILPTPVGSAHSNELLETLEATSPKIIREKIKDSNETTPTLTRHSLRPDDTLSCGSCDTDDLADERLQEQIPLHVQHVYNEKECQNYPWDDIDNVPVEGEEEREGVSPTVTIALISRRSRYRAGTRYLRRGVDSAGCVANYVETEMLLQVSTHLISFIVVRGSVPVYWTQPGNKYRPLPIIQQTDEETAQAFERHFETQLNLYEKEVLINLINQTGRERIVSEAYEKQLIRLNCSSLTYVAFDFHHHCKVNQWHNINLLLDAIQGYFNDQKYFWVDLQYNKEPLCQQKGVFRVNCMDCLDRTNVVQSVLCKETIQTALQKLSLLTPFGSLSGQFLRHYQELWGNNGDTISRQYTGTAAMKGDLTRYGHRRLYGVMKDGYNSANRYLQSLFRDAYRQVVIDLQQGTTPQEALTSLSHSQRGIEDEEHLLRPPIYSELPSWSSEREQVIADMIKTCRDNLFPNTTVPVKGWALIEPTGYSFVPTSDTEEDTVLLLCIERRHICVANYNSDFEQVACCIRIPLDRIDRITIGSMGTILRSSRRLYMRLHYTLFPGCSCYFTFRSVRSLSLEEDKLTLLTLAQELAAIQPTISIQEQRLSKKSSPPHEGIVYLIAPSEWTIDPWETVLSPRSTTNHQEEGSEGRSIFYDQLSSSSTISGGSSSNNNTSGIVALINLNSPIGSDKMKSGYESSNEEEEDDEGQVSFSAPSSPNLIRRTNIMSLQERSRLLSHSSLEDLPSLATTPSDTVTKEEKEARKRRTSLGFLILESPSSGAEANDEAEEDEDRENDDDEISVDISKVLSTSRLNSIHFHQYMASEELPPMRLRIPSPPIVIAGQLNQDSSFNKREKSKDKMHNKEESSSNEKRSSNQRSPTKQRKGSPPKQRERSSSEKLSPNKSTERPHSVQLTTQESDGESSLEITNVGKKNTTLPPNLSLSSAIDPSTASTTSSNSAGISGNSRTSDTKSFRSSNNGSSSSSSRQVSRWKIGKLFQKSNNKLQQQSSHDSLMNNEESKENTNSSNSSNSSGVKHNVVQAIGILKGLKTSRNSSSTSVSSTSNNDQSTTSAVGELQYTSSGVSDDEGLSNDGSSINRRLLNDAMKSSRTKFIII